MINEGLNHAIADTYQHALGAQARQSQVGASGVPQDVVQAFAGQDWVSKTAFITYHCALSSASVCKKIVSVAAFDDSLFVRTHALRFVDKASFLSSEKHVLKKEMLADSRNYRRRKPLWIITQLRQKPW